MESLVEGKCIENTAEVKRIAYFKPTKEELEEGKKKTYARLMTLDFTQQLYIAHKYYGSKMPWAKVTEDN